MWTSMLLSVVIVLPTTGQASAPADMEKLCRLLDDKPADNLPAARALFEGWYKADPHNAALQAFRLRLTTLHALRDEISAQLRSAGHNAVGRMVTAILDGQDAPKSGDVSKTDTAAVHAVVSAEELYRRYLPGFRYPLNARGLQPAQKTFLRGLYNAEIRVAILEIMRVGRSLATAADAKSSEVEYYLLVLPLLHEFTAFSVESMRDMPGWMLTPEHLRLLADFCLFRAGRLDAAEAISLNLKDQRPAPETKLAFRVEAAGRCVVAHQPALAVECLKAAQSLLEPRDPRVTEIRFRICTVWAEAKNWALAAGEAGRLAHDFAGSPDGAKAFCTRIGYLAAQGDAQTLLQEVDDALNDPRCEPWFADLHYYKWKALRQLDRGQEAGIVLKRFLDRYPADPRGAEMYFSVARDCLSAQRYDQALAILESLKTRYPNSSHALRARQLLENLYQTRARPDSRPASQPEAS